MIYSIWNRDGTRVMVELRGWTVQLAIIAQSHSDASYFASQRLGDKPGYDLVARMMCISTDPGQRFQRSEAKCPE